VSRLSILDLVEADKTIDEKKRKLIDSLIHDSKIWILREKKGSN
jgi:hypothetical protein